MLISTLCTPRIPPCRPRLPASCPLLCKPPPTNQRHANRGAIMQLNPYLSFKGDCEQAFKFYEACLGGKITMMSTFKGTPAESHVPPEWADKIIHARLVKGDIVLMGSDAMPNG